MKNSRLTPRHLPIFSLLVAGLCLCFSLESQAYEPDTEFADVVNSKTGKSFADEEERDYEILSLRGHKPSLRYTNICIFGLDLLKDDNDANNKKLELKYLKSMPQKMPRAAWII